MLSGPKDKPKYKFTGETRKWTEMVPCEITLYRIKRLSDGKLGGWVESEANLSQKGTCWVDEDAVIFGDAQVLEHAQVYGRAWICNRAIISGNAKVYGVAVVSDDARVYERAEVYDNAQIWGDAQVYGDAKVFNGGDNFWFAVKDNARIYGTAEVCGEVAGDAEVCGNAKVFGKVAGKTILKDGVIVKHNATVSCKTKTVFENTTIDSDILGNTNNKKNKKAKKHNKNISDRGM